MMSDSELPAHWRFAVGNAIARLQGLVRSFDFRRESQGLTYAGAEPQRLLAVVDGLLGESDVVLFAGDRTTLQKLRMLLLDRVQPASEQGLVAGRRQWSDGGRIYRALGTEELHRLALEQAPDAAMLCGWFAEGFCFAYSSEEMYSLRSESNE